jgi:hypothetical protein
VGGAVKLVCQECGKVKQWSLFARDVERGSCKACRLVAMRQIILMKTHVEDTRQKDYVFKRDH